MTTPAITKFKQHVVAQLGEEEHPLGSNHTKYGAQFGWNDVSWCVEFGYDMYDDAGMELPLKTASCVAMYDECEKEGLLRQTSTHAVPGDSIIRTWQHLPRNRLDPAETHFQIVVGVHWDSGVQYLDLIGGNQGPGLVSRDLVRAGDVSILGALAFASLFEKPHGKPPKQAQDKRTDLPATKSHKYPHAMVSLGSHGALVGQVQTELAQHGFYRGRIDNSFGPQTYAAVLAFQKEHWPHDSKQWDGIVGPQTYKALGF